MVRESLSGLLNRPPGIRNLGCSWNRAAGLSVVVMLTMLVTSNHRPDQGPSEWELTPLVTPIITNMNGFLATKSAASKFSHCDANVLHLEGDEDPLTAPFVNQKLGINGTDAPPASPKTDKASAVKHKDGNQQFVKALILSAPCG